MATTTRATVYLDAKLHDALRIKAASTRRSISDIVSDAVREALRDDEEDLSAVSLRAAEPTVSYEELLRQLKTDGTI